MKKKYQRSPTEIALDRVQLDRLVVRDQGEERIRIPGHKKVEDAQELGSVASPDERVSKVVGDPYAKSAVLRATGINDWNGDIDGLLQVDAARKALLDRSFSPIESGEPFDDGLSMARVVVRDDVLTVLAMRRYVGTYARETQLHDARSEKGYAKPHVPARQVASMTIRLTAVVDSELAEVVFGAPREQPFARVNGQQADALELVCTCPVGGRAELILSQYFERSIPRSAE